METIKIGEWVKKNNKISTPMVMLKYKIKIHQYRWDKSISKYKVYNLAIYKNLKNNYTCTVQSKSCTTNEEINKKNTCHVPYFKGIQSYTLPHCKNCDPRFFCLLNDFIRLTWNNDGEIISMPCKVVVTLSGVCMLWWVRGIMLMECWLICWCVCFEFWNWVHQLTNVLRNMFCVG